MKTKQTKFWKGDFGREYTQRNPQSLKQWDKYYINSFGFRKTDMFAEFLGDLDRNIRILEVGCNIGLQLMGLQRMGFNNLYGIELLPYAVEKAKILTDNINIIHGSGFDIPFKNKFFNLVFTSGVLIHIAPNDLPKIMKEMIRCTEQFILGHEYYAAEPTELNYHGNEGLLWKMDYSSEFQKVDKNLLEIKRKIYPYISKNEKGNEDLMYLLERC